MQDYLGTGLTYPIRIDANGRWLTVTGVDLVAQSLAILLSTNSLEVVYNAHYGADLYKTIGQPNDYVIQSLLKHYIKKSIDTHEPRVEFVNCDITLDHEKALCKITVKLLASNEVTIIPFYFRRNY